MAFERWDVVTALFPFTDVAIRRPRPVLVLSGAGFNRNHGHLIGCMITRAARSRWPSDHDILDLAGDRAAARIRRSLEIVHAAVHGGFPANRGSRVRRS